ncbi:MAG: hypothetical protein KDK66_01420, partial [Deltaproteobacteria bacterium]|nr:hypothetical protein [Deltaproteobacteria bacterium]
FFFFFEDYARTDMEWEDNELASKSRKPAFEIIFVYSQSQGSLEVYFEGRKTVATKLQEMFVQTIMAIEKLPKTIQDRVYELNPLKSPEFTFNYGAGSGIKEVKIKELRFTLLPQARNLILKVKPDDPPDAIYTLINQFFARGHSSTNYYPLGMTQITQATISAVITDSSCKKGEVKKTIKITWPDGCNLKNEDKDPILRKMLVDSGLEVAYEESERESKAG